MKEESVIVNIIKIRTAQGLTKREVADAIGMNEASCVILSCQRKRTQRC